jgi:hypothetical protein
MKFFIAKQHRQLVMVLALPVFALLAFMFLPPAYGITGPGHGLNPGQVCAPGICMKNGCSLNSAQACNSDGSGWNACGSC